MTLESKYLTTNSRLKRNGHSQNNFKVKRENTGIAFGYFLQIKSLYEMRSQLNYLKQSIFIDRPISSLDIINIFQVRLLLSGDFF